MHFKKLTNSFHTKIFKFNMEFRYENIIKICKVYVIFKNFEFFFSKLAEKN